MATSAKKTTKSKAAAGTKLRCGLAFSVQVSPTDSTVTQGATKGKHAGAVKCRAKELGTGVEFDSFTTDGAGDISGTWQEWFNTGSVYGSYTLAPNESRPPTAQSFAAASYTGGFTIKGGTGADAKTTGKGTMACATPNSIQYTCKESGKLRRM
ncbi:MAG: hypothetical protein M3065_16075 [Actinomycetota bacterium]|nr:hypothetical protein [Actinomycetota bacterium]